MKISLAVVATAITSASAFSASSFTGKAFKAPTSTSALCMKYKVAVVGGGPAGACAAEIFAQEKGIDTVLFERKLDNAKPCGGAIPLCMVGEFDLPESVVDRKVRTTTRCRPSRRRRSPVTRSVLGLCCVGVLRFQADKWDVAAAMLTSEGWNR
jgi:flavin-dependent dehydrogenase